MKKKYKIILYTLIISFTIVVVCGIGYLNFEKPIEESDNAFVYVDGKLSFNFLEGNIIDTLETEKEYHFSVTNTSQDPYYYNISIENGSGGDNTEFELTSMREGFQTIKKNYPENTSQFATAIKINGNETHSYTFKISNPSAKKISGIIKTSLEKDMNTFANVILKNNIVNTSPKTSVANETASEEEGLIESTDDDGTSYYFRGSANNNYVKFAEKTWRIVKINGNKTVKLVLDNLSHSSVQYYTTEEEIQNDFTVSRIYQNLNEWYQSNLNNYDIYIANEKYCSDFTYDDNGFSSLTRIYINHSPLFECLGNAPVIKIGLLTSDEIAYAGATKNENNTNFYLYNSEIHTSWWTMSPAKNFNGTYSFIEISQNGKMNEGTNGTLFRGARPVINIIKKATVSGSGTINDPYTVNNM